MFQPILAISQQLSSGTLQSVPAHGTVSFVASKPFSAWISTGTIGVITVSSDVDFYVRYTTIGITGTVITGFVGSNGTFPAIIGRKYAFVVYFKTIPKQSVSVSVQFY